MGPRNFLYGTRRPRRSRFITWQPKAGALETSYGTPSPNADECVPCSLLNWSVGRTSRNGRDQQHVEMPTASALRENYSLTSYTACESHGCWRELGIAVSPTARRSLALATHASLCSFLPILLSVLIALLHHVFDKVFPCNKLKATLSDVLASSPISASEGEE